MHESYIHNTHTTTKLDARLKKKTRTGKPFQNGCWWKWFCGAIFLLYRICDESERLWYRERDLVILAMCFWANENCAEIEKPYFWGIRNEWEWSGSGATDWRWWWWWWCNRRDWLMQMHRKWNKNEQVDVKWARS